MTYSRRAKPFAVQQASADEAILRQGSVHGAQRSVASPAARVSCPAALMRALGAAMWPSGGTLPSLQLAPPCEVSLACSHHATPFQVGVQ